MSILVTSISSATAKISEHKEIERDWYGIGSVRWRWVYTVTLSWPCDATGAVGDTLPATYTNSDSVSCDLQGGAPTLNSHGLNGTYNARYYAEGSWNY